MTTERKVIDFKIHNLTEEQFQELKEAGQIDPNALYCTPDETVANFEKLNERIDTVNERIDTANEQINTKQDVATAVNYGHVTNCITESSKNLLFTVSGNILTLKAGSKVYVPNGPDVYETQNIVEDISVEIPNDWNYDFWIFKQASANTLDFVETATSDVSSSSPVPGDYVEYNSTENVCGLYLEYSGFARYESLPLAYVTMANGQLTIREIYSDVGLIGKVLFVLPGIKMLMPNGRNADGTLKNIYKVSDSVKTLKNNNNSAAFELVYQQNDTLGVSDIQYWQYSPLHNKYIHNEESTTYVPLCLAGTSDRGTYITAFLQYQPFQVASYQDLQNNIPAGVVVPFAGSTPPAGWLKCDGSAVSRERYAKLFAAIGTTYGRGDNRTTFNLPTQSVLPLGTSAKVTVYGTSKSIQVTDGTNNASLAAGMALGTGNRVGVGTKIENLNKGDQGSGFAALKNDTTIGLKTSTTYGDSGIVGTADIANATGAKAIVCIKY